MLAAFTSRPLSRRAAEASSIARSNDPAARWIEASAVRASARLGLSFTASVSSRRACATSFFAAKARPRNWWAGSDLGESLMTRSEEHTSELQSLAYLVCRLLLEKKKKKR